MPLPIIAGTVKAASSGWAWLRTGGHWKAVLGALTALAAALTIIFLLWRVDTLRASEKALSEALAASQGEVKLLRDARAADQEAVTFRDRLVTKIITVEKDRSAKLEAAIAANPDWASQPVPAAVIDSLRQD